MGNSAGTRSSIKEITNETPYHVEVIADSSSSPSRIISSKTKESFDWGPSQKLLFHTVAFSEPSIDLAKIEEGPQPFVLNAVQSEDDPDKFTVVLKKPPTNIKTLKVITYNTHLFEGSNATLGAVITTVISAKSLDVGPMAAYQKGLDRVLYDDTNRSSELVKYLRLHDADLVALQEVWSHKMVSFISDTLKDKYPHIWSPEESTIDLKVSSGLLLLSKYPMSSFAITKYLDLHGDCGWANKGVLQATVFLPVDDAYYPVRVCVTHAGTDVGGPGLPNMKQLAGTVQHVKYPAILLGDFNVTTPQNSEMNDILEEVGCTDAYRTVYPELGPEHNSVDRSLNKLDQFFAAIPGSLNADRIDYIYFKKGLGVQLEPIKANVIRDWQYRSDYMDVSDHYPVCCVFKLSLPC